MTDEEVKELLQRAMPPSRDAQLTRDLWPELERRTRRTERRITPFDWALIAAAVAGTVVAPEMLLMLLYHL
jgi:hypothetical protein